MGTCDHQQMQTSNKSSKSRRRSFKEDSGSETPTKKRLLDFHASRVDTNSDSTVTHTANLTIVELNNQAVSLYRKGDFHEASTLFQKAASLGQRGDAQQHSLLRSTPTLLLPASIDPLESIEIPPLEAAASHAPIAVQPPKTSYIYQRMEFDEGMTYHYSQAEPVRMDDPPLVLQATLLFNAGQTWRKLEDFDKASLYYEQARQTLKSEAPGLPILIPILHSTGQLLYRMGKPEAALEAYQEALEACRDIHGMEDMSVAITLNCLGVLYYHMSVDHSEKAMKCFKDSLHIQIKVLDCALEGKDDGDEFDMDKATPQIATTLNNLGRVHVQRDEFEPALVHYERALQIRKRCLGRNHIDYAATAFNAGQSLHQLKTLDRAIHLYREFLRVALAKFGTKDHRDIAVVLSGIAQIHQERKEYDLALDLYEESIRVGRAALGQHHSEVAMLLNRIGNFHFEHESFESALEAYKEGLLIERKVLDKSHPNIIVTLSNIGEVYRQMNDFESAIRLYHEALRLQRLRFGLNSAEVATTLNMIGLIYDQKGDSSMALKQLQQALVLRRTVLGDDHLDVAATLTYLGTILYRKSMVSTAMQLLMESLRIRQDQLGRDHRDVSFTMYNVGLCHQLQGDYEEAIECFCETLRVEKLVLGDDHRDVSMTMYKLGEAYKAHGDLIKALESFQTALSIEKETIGLEDPATIARTWNEIGNIHLLRGDIVPMMEALSEAARIFRRTGLSQSSLAVAHQQLYAFDISCPSAAPAA
jgi:tetratricopeptide (TPR) repeat protein